MTKRALIHVDNTDNVVELAQYLASAGWTIISANKTEELLRKNHVPVTREMALSTDVAYAHDITKVITSIVSTRLDSENSLSTISEYQDNNIFLVCINISPFYYTDPQKADVRYCDYRISSILRYAFYNHKNILVLTDPADYKEALIQLKTDNITDDFRTYIAQKALNLVAAYDSGIAGTFANKTNYKKSFPMYACYPLQLQSVLKHGTNPQQTAAFYKLPDDTGTTTFANCNYTDIDYTIFKDVTLSWEILNNLHTSLKSQFTVDSTNADNYDFTTQFTPLAGTVFTFVVKFGNLMGASIATNIHDSYLKTHFYDTKNVKNEVLGCSAVIDHNAAKEIMEGSFSAIVAPDFTDEAKKIFAQNRNIKLVYSTRISQADFEARFVFGGFLIQQREKTLFNHWYIKTKTRPSQLKSDELAFGMLLALKTRSYSALLIKQNAIVGVAQACPSMEKALGEVHYFVRAYTLLHNGNTDFNPNDNPIADVLVVDEKIHFGEEIIRLIDLGLSTIIETGGAPDDDEFIKYCDDHNVSLIFTGMSHISL
ncbi:MAG: hypothetical protein K6C98_04425 [Treponema sp.]|nr:hypothetical protein [Treponema sp.]